MSDAGAVREGWRTRGWLLQQFWDDVARAFGVTSTADAQREVTILLLRAMSLLMVAAPILIEVWYLAAGIVLISPPLLATFLAGFVGFGLSRRRLWRRISLNEIFAREGR
jgi:hypothetical protein